MGTTDVRMGILPVTVLGLAMLAGPLTSAGSPAVAGYDFKGLELGAPTTAAEVQDRLNTPCVNVVGGACDALDAKLHEQQSIRCGLGSEGMTVCNGVTTVVGAVSRVTLVISAEGLLQRVMVSEFDADQFDAVFAELQRKFGRPKTVSKPVLENGFGARFQQVQATWTDSQRRQVTVWKYSGTSNESCLYFGTLQDQQLMNRLNQGTKGDL